MQTNRKGLEEQGAHCSKETGEFENKDQTLRKRLENLSKRSKQLEKNNNRSKRISESEDKEQTARKRLENFRTRSKPLENG